MGDMTAGDLPGTGAFVPGGACGRSSSVLMRCEIRGGRRKEPAAAERVLHDSSGSRRRTTTQLRAATMLAGDRCGPRMRDASSYEKSPRKTRRQGRASGVSFLMHGRDLGDMDTDLAGAASNGAGREGLYSPGMNDMRLRRGESPRAVPRIRYEQRATVCRLFGDCESESQFSHIRERTMLFTRCDKMSAQLMADGDHDRSGGASKAQLGGGHPGGSTTVFTMI